MKSGQSRRVKVLVLKKKRQHPGRVMFLIEVVMLVYPLVAGDLA